MMSMPLSQAADMLSTRYEGTDVTFTGISTDTRTLEKGNLFVALQGPNFDGHDHLDAALSRGAVAAAVSESVDASMPLLRVADTRIALGQLAKQWRMRFDIPVVGITGSNGKTTVKEMVASILSQHGKTLSTAGNFNNDIGLPKTLFRLDDSYKYAVIEMGANHAGEIAYLANLAIPNVAILNNAGPAHLEGFGSIEGVARAKGEIFESLRGQGTAIINADDPFASYWRETAIRCDIIDFGLDHNAAVTADIELNPRSTQLTVKTPKGEFRTTLSLPGRHNALNALAATAAAVALDIDLDQIAAGLASLQSVKGRLQILPGKRGSWLIDDTYNANPVSLKAGLAVLNEQAGEHWLVLGDMGELGADGERLHEHMAEAAHNSGVSRLFVIGTLAARTAQSFGKDAVAFEKMEDLCAALEAELHKDVTILVKGSRAMSMERVINALREGEEGSKHAGISR